MLADVWISAKTGKWKKAETEWNKVGAGGMGRSGAGMGRLGQERG